MVLSCRAALRALVLHQHGRSLWLRQFPQFVCCGLEYADRFGHSAKSERRARRACTPAKSVILLFLRGWFSDCCDMNRKLES
eukprot:4354427-Amphidinium_carterae.1